MRNLILIVSVFLASCTTYNVHDSYNTTDVRINDLKIQRSAINPHNPYKREIK